MRKRHLLLVGVMIAVLLVAVAVAACGSSSTSTTATTAGPATTAGGATTTAAGGAIDAAALYAANCKGCHQNPPSGSADDIKATITNGKGSGMPSFKDKLTADQIAALAAWVANGGK